MKLIYLFCLVFLFPLNQVFSETEIENIVITQSQDWNHSNSPIIIQGEVTIPRGVTVTVHEGVNINFINGHINVEGELLLLGYPTQKIRIIQDEESTGIFSNGGHVYFLFVDSIGGKSLLDAYGSSAVDIFDLSIKEMKGYDSIFTVREKASVSLKKVNAVNLDAPLGINVYDDGQLHVEDSVFSNVGNSITISSHGKNELGTRVEVKTSTFKDSASAFEIYDQSVLSIDDSVIERMRDTGVRMYGFSTTTILKSRISLNNIGIQSSESFLNINNSRIEFNTEYGLFRTAGSFIDKDNVYNPEQTNLFLPKQILFLEGDLNNKKKATSTLCCSNILFIPGIKASRLYKKQTTGENQLWEPNLNADVDKLYLNSQGVSIGKNIYTRDYIDKTNIGADVFDKEIYLEFTNFLNETQRSGLINSWSGYPYDWRKSPLDVVTENQKLDIGMVSLVSEIERLASSSKNMKVTVIGHSYGGVISKYLIKHLYENGKINLIDNLILIAVPESGTVESVGAMLHGDDQEIAGGLILDSETARGLGQNMPSVYYLLPNDDLVTHINEPIIKHDGTDWFNAYSGFKIDDPVDFNRFLLNTNKKRPYARSLSDTRLPLNLNSFLFNKMKDSQISIDSFDYKRIPINIYNIVGTGLDTVQSYLYYKNECNDSLLAKVKKYSDRYCGFDHDEGYTNKGDGTVLVGDTSKRWGNKYFFDMFKYNLDHQVNYSHADIVSANPVHQMIEYITRMQDLNILPSYISQGTSEYIDDSYEYSIEDGLEMEAEDDEGRVTGYISKVTSRKMRLIRKTIPNSKYKKVGNKNKLIVKKKVKKIKLTPVIKTAKPKTVKFFSLKSKKVKNKIKEDEFEFKDVPVTPESKIEVELLPASTTPAVIHIDLYGDGNVVVIPPSYPKATTTQEHIDVHTLIMQIIKEVQESQLKQVFKNRYVLRLKNIDKWYMKDKIHFSYILGAREVNSLSSIVKELRKTKPRYYRGGLKIEDSLFLLPKFEKIANGIKLSF